MTALLIVLLIALAFIAAISAFMQTLYFDSQRLIGRPTAALEYFKDSIEDRLGWKAERGALNFSLLKHTALLFLGLVWYAVLSRQILPAESAFLEAALLSWATMILVAYLLPQLVYRKTSGRWMAVLIAPLKLLGLLVAPIAVTFEFLHSLSDLGARKNEDPEMEEEHLDALMTAGEEEGLVDAQDRKMIEFVVAFGDKRVREVMTPRPNITAIEQRRSLEELRQLAINEQYSRIPVYDGTIDRIEGFVHVRDMFELEPDERHKCTVKALVRPIHKVPETKKVVELLREFQEQGRQMAVVIDEYGNTAGIATMEDLVEEVFGEIRDEHEPAEEFIETGEGEFEMSGSFAVDGLKQLAGFRPPDETESTTVGGLAAEWLGRVPKPGESVENHGLRIEVLAAGERRVEKVKVRRLAPPAEGKNGNGNGH